MKSFYRVMLGQKSVHADECFAGNFIGTDFGINQDLTKRLPEDWRSFNKEFIPIYLASHPDKTKIGAGLACGALWTVSKGIQKSDVVLCPDGTGRYRVGEVSGSYYYEPGKVLFHRRPVTWLNVSIDRAAMSEALRHSAGSIGTVSNITQHHTEIEKLIAGISIPKLISTDASIEDPSRYGEEISPEEAEAVAAQFARRTDAQLWLPRLTKYQVLMRRLAEDFRLRAEALLSELDGELTP